MHWNRDTTDTTAQYAASGALSIREFQIQIHVCIVYYLKYCDSIYKFTKYLSLIRSICIAYFEKILKSCKKVQKICGVSIHISQEISYW